ncbi:MAG: hypothetical protein HOI31_06060, partial [Gammaproteobacteria bacterium]|nr:hypothetical protein [Gammaproteobacteria bacterium]
SVGRDLMPMASGIRYASDYRLQLHSWRSFHFSTPTGTGCAKLHKTD